MPFVDLDYLLFSGFQFNLIWSKPYGAGPAAFIWPIKILAAPGCLIRLSCKPEPHTKDMSQAALQWPYKSFVRSFERLNKTILLRPVTVLIWYLWWTYLRQMEHYKGVLTSFKWILIFWTILISYIKLKTQSRPQESESLHYSWSHKRISSTSSTSWFEASYCFLHPRRVISVEGPPAGDEKRGPTFSAQWTRFSKDWSVVRCGYINDIMA